MDLLNVYQLEFIISGLILLLFTTHKITKNGVEQFWYNRERL